MAELVYFIPKEGLTVPKNPRWEGGYFAPAGEWAQRDDFLDRRVAEGAGRYGEPPAPPPVIAARLAAAPTPAEPAEPAPAATATDPKE